MLMKKNRIGIREARIHFSRLIREVRSGNEYVITDRGTPVARIIPDEGKPLSLEERIKNFENSGIIESCCGESGSTLEPIELPYKYLHSRLEEERGNG